MLSGCWPVQLVRTVRRTHVCGWPYAKTRKCSFIPKTLLKEEVQKTITPEMLIPSLDIDAALSFQEISPKFTRILAQFHPFGPGNLNPVFVTKNVIDTGYSNLVGSDKKHLKLSVHGIRHEKDCFKRYFF